MNETPASPFEPNVRAIEARYRDSLPQGKVLLFGSSFMEFWRTSADDLLPLETINVGIGGTRVGDWASFYQRIVVPFHPRAMLVYAGSNDISGDETSKTGDEMFEELLAFFGNLNQALPGVPLHYISIAPTLARWHVWQHAHRANTLVQEWCKVHPDQYHFINCTPALLTDTGEPLPDIFEEDRLHFNSKGYQVWRAVIQPNVLKTIPPVPTVPR